MSFIIAESGSANAVQVAYCPLPQYHVRPSVFYMAIFEFKRLSKTPKWTTEIIKDTIIASAVVWNLWKCRNSLLFDNGSGTVAELVEAVKISSWKWWMSRASAAHCLLYEWRMEPRLCMLR
jgi:hypothetical protein